MESLVSVAVQSVSQMPVRHVGNAVAGSTAVIVAPDWLGIACGIAALIASCALLYKTFQDIKINNRTLSEGENKSEE